MSSPLQIVPEVTEMAPPRLTGNPVPFPEVGVWLSENPANEIDIKYRRVMIDVDGILFPFTAAFSSVLPGEDFGEDDCPAWLQYPRQFDQAELENAKRYAHSKEAILKFGLYENVVAGMELLLQSGLEVHIVTRRDPEFAAPTAEALAQLGLRWHSYLAAPDIDKVAWCLDNGVAIMADDKPSTIEAASAAGIHVVGQRWAYNQQLERLPGVQLVKGFRMLAPGIVALADFLSRRARGVE